VLLKEHLAFLRVLRSNTQSASPNIPATQSALEIDALTPLSALPDNSPQRNVTGMIQMHRDANDRSIVLTIPSRRIVLPESALPDGSEASSLIRSFLEAPGAFMIPFSDQAVLEWLRIRGVYPFDRGFSCPREDGALEWAGNGDAVDALQDSAICVMPQRRVELLIEGMKVCN
jgi:hypothetical protein